MHHLATTHKITDGRQAPDRRTQHCSRA